MTTPRVLLPLVLLAACQGPPASVTRQCLPSWPAATPVVAPVAPLAQTPALLWRVPVTGASPNDWLLLSGAHVAFTAGGRLYLRSREDGSDQGGRSSAAFERVSSAVADDAGNFYFVGQSAYSVDANAAWRWMKPLAGAPGGNYYKDAPSAGRTSALAPDGTLYVGASDGALYAIDTRDGTQKWRREVAKPADGDRGPIVVGGIGGALLTVTRAKATRSAVFDATTGVPLQGWTFAGDPLFPAFFAPTLGIVGQRMADHGGPYPWMDLVVQDACGQTRWSLPATRPQWPALLGADESLYVVERDDVTGSDTFVSVYAAADGKRTLGPVKAAPPWGIGADGVVYAVECDAPGHDGPSRLIAYEGATLTEKWRLELGASCPSAGPVIDETGRLYFTWFIDHVTELVAVQTTSPGLASTPWPTRRHDAHGTAWVK
jgi:outer membrane protein assembly factor BamB